MKYLIIELSETNDLDIRILTHNKELFKSSNKLS